MNTAASKVPVERHVVPMTPQHRALMRTCMEAWSRYDGHDLTRPQILERLHMLKVHGLCGLGLRRFHASTKGGAVFKTSLKDGVRVCKSGKQRSLFGGLVLPRGPPYTIHEAAGIDTGRCYVCNVAYGERCTASNAALVEFNHRRCITCAAHGACLLCAYVASDFKKASHTMASAVLNALTAWLKSNAATDTVAVLCRAADILPCVQTFMGACELPVCRYDDWATRGLSTLHRSKAAPLVLLLTVDDSDALSTDASRFFKHVHAVAVLGTQEVPVWLASSPLVSRLATFYVR